MRIGTNPNAEAVLPGLPEVVACVITHLPNEEGYHKKRFDVIERCLDSLKENAKREIPLMVWDNGSHHDFQDWLLNGLYPPEYLMLSPNIGKANARTAITRMFPPETVLAISDDDIYFEPNWLEPQLELLRGFPNVGTVSGCPTRTQFRFSNTAAMSWGKENDCLKVGRFIPDEWEYDFCRSIERDYMQHLEETQEEQDYLLEWNGLKAYAQGHHMQMIGYAGKLAQIPIWSSKAMRNERTFEEMIDRMGWLRLSTTERYTRHIGNVPEEF